MSGRYGVEARTFRALLETMGIRLEDGSGEARLGVVLVDGYQRTELAEYNAESLRDGRAVAPGPPGRPADLDRSAVSPRVSQRAGSAWPIGFGRTRPLRPISRAGAAARRGRRRHRRLTGHAPGRAGPDGQRRCDLDRPG